MAPWAALLLVGSIGPAARARGFEGGLNGFAPLIVTPDGRYAVTGDESAALVWWDLATGKPARRVSGHQDAVWALAVSADGRFILSGSWDRTLRLWRADTGAPLETIDAGGGAIFSVALSSDGRRALSGDSAGAVKLWDMERGRLIRALTGERGTILTAEFLADGRRALTAGLDDRAYLWDLASGRPLRTFAQPGHCTIDHALSPDQRFAVLAGPSSLRLVALASGKTIRTFAQELPPHADVPMAFSPDGRYFLIEGGDFRLNLWETATGRLAKTYAARRSLGGVAFTPDGREIVASISTPKKPGWLMSWPTAGAPSDGPPERQPPAARPNPARSAALAKLGRRLFFDPRLSSSGLISCATCHDPRKGWADGRRVSIGAGGRQGRRNALSVLNAALHRPLMWDGRAASLEEQVRLPFEDRAEMDTEPAVAVRNAAAIAGYRPLFKAALGDEAVSFARLAAAIAAFERTLVSLDSPYDRSMSGDARALSPAAAAGMKVFMGKGHCFACHQLAGAKGIDSTYENLGIASGSRDQGRYEVTRRPRERGAFLAPDLHNLLYTAPYMHDGSLPTLADVVDFYDRGGGTGPDKAFQLALLHLTREEKASLVSFLEALSGDPLALETPRLPR